MVHPNRIQALNGLPARNPAERGGKADYVLYWMQAAQRAEWNDALEHAIELANGLALPVVVGFGLMDDYPEANLRHYSFMVQGLAEVAARLRERGILFVIRHGRPADVALELGRRAAVIVCDRGYTRHQRAWRDTVADKASCAVVRVEGEVVVPVETVSQKHEYAARTIRPRVMRHWEEFLRPLTAVKLQLPSLGMTLRSDFDLSDWASLLKRLKLDRSVSPVARFAGGETEGRRRLKRFVSKTLSGYAEGRNEPGDDFHSYMSPYLHFGMISAVEVALAVREADAPQADRAAYLEELIVRRELSMNFCEFVADYDAYSGLTDWAKKTLADRAGDAREVLYSLAQLEAAQTLDPYWNAAMTEMVATGFMHNYMRMYWGKKIIEWSVSPEEAFAHTLHLNNKYFLDGRDPNSFANVAWLFGTHDRPWGPARKIFGTVRYMNRAGLERKFEMQRYVQKVQELAGEER